MWRTIVRNSARCRSRARIAAFGRAKKLLVVFGKGRRHIHDHCLCLHAQRAARALARHFGEAFRLLGLTNGQFSLLISLDRPEPPRLGSVAALLAMDRTTLTAALKPLERRGLIVVKEDSTDRRSRRPLLTEDGRALLSEAVPIWRSTHDDLDALLAGAAVNDLPNGLRKVSELLQHIFGVAL